MPAISPILLSNCPTIEAPKKMSPKDTKELGQLTQDSSSVEKYTPNYDQLDLGQWKEFHKDAAEQAQWDEEYDNLARQNPEYRSMNYLKDAVNNCEKDVEHSQKLHQAYQNGISYYQGLLNGAQELTSEQKQEYTYKLTDLQQQEQSLMEQESETGVPDFNDVLRVRIFSSSLAMDSNFAETGADVQEDCAKLKNFSISASDFSGFMKGTGNLLDLLKNMSNAVDSAWDAYHNQQGNEPNAPGKLTGFKNLFHVTINDFERQQQEAETALFQKFL